MVSVSKEQLERAAKKRMGDGAIVKVSTVRNVGADGDQWLVFAGCDVASVQVVDADRGEAMAACMRALGEGR